MVRLDLEYNILCVSNTIFKIIFNQNYVSRIVYIHIMNVITKLAYSCRVEYYVNIKTENRVKSHHQIIAIQ